MTKHERAAATAASEAEAHAAKAWLAASTDEADLD